MLTLNQWLRENHSEDSLIEQQLALLADRIEGLLHDVEPSQRKELSERFIKELQVRLT